MNGNPLDHFSDGQRVRLTLIKSPIGSLKRHKAGLRTLGFRKMHQTKDITWSATMRGIVQHCVHFLKVEGVVV